MKKETIVRLLLLCGILVLVVILNALCIKCQHIITMDELASLKDTPSIFKA